MGYGLWSLATLLLACHFALNLQQNGKTYLNADAYSHYVAKRPYQYRVLMAPVMGALVRTYSQPSAEAVLGKLPVYVSTAEAATYVSINAIGFAASCLLIFAIARRALVEADSRAIGSTVAIYIGMAYFFFCLNPNVAFILPYDVPALALSQACILCVLTRRWRWLYPLFALATLNRETSFLVIVFMAARLTTEDAAGGRESLSRVGALCGLWLLVKAILFLVFSGLPSDEGLRLVYNLRSLLKPWQWPALLPLLASVSVSCWTLRASPASPAWAVTGIIGFAMTLVVGQLTETRAFADLMVFFSLAVGQWLTPCIRPGANSADPVTRSSRSHHS